MTPTEKCPACGSIGGWAPLGRYCVICGHREPNRKERREAEMAELKRRAEGRKPDA